MISHQWLINEPTMLPLQEVKDDFIPSVGRCPRCCRATEIVTNIDNEKIGEHCHFCWIVDDQREIRRCRMNGCERVFVVGKAGAHGNQKYCSKGCRQAVRVAIRKERRAKWAEYNRRRNEAAT